MQTARNDFDLLGWTTEQVEDFLRSNEFVVFRQLETGEWIGILKLAFTWSVCMDIGEVRAFTYRWCFEDANEAFLFYTTAVDFDEVPESRVSLKGHRWISSKGPLTNENDERGFPKW